MQAALASGLSFPSFVLGVHDAGETRSDRFVALLDLTFTRLETEADTGPLFSSVQQGSLYPGKKTVSTNVFVREK